MSAAATRPTRTRRRVATARRRSDSTPFPVIAVPPPRHPTAAELQRTWLLEGAPLDVLEGLAANCEERRYTAGETLFHQGDDSVGLFLVVAGTVRVLTPTEEGDLLLATLGQGECLGEMGVLDSQPRSATAVAATLLVTYFVPAAAFLDTLERAPRLALKLLVVLCSRMRRTNRLAAEVPGAARLHRELDLEP